MGFDVVIDLSCEGGSESCEVCPSVTLGNIVGKAEAGFVVSVIPLEGDIDDDVVTFVAYVDGGFVKDLSISVSPLDESDDAAFIFEGVDDGVIASVVGEGDRDSVIEEGEFS